MRATLLAWGVWALLLRRLSAHLAVLNDGSPTPAQAMLIDDPTLSQAFYGRLRDGAAEFYRFEAAPDAATRLSLLVPLRFFAAGMRPTVTLCGAGLPPGGLVLPPGDHGTREGSARFQRTQRWRGTLAGGSYTVELRGGAGVYCFCIGTREPGEPTDAATKARIAALLES